MREMCKYMEKGKDQASLGEEKRMAAKEDANRHPGNEVGNRRQ